MKRLSFILLCMTLCITAHANVLSAFPSIYDTQKNNLFPLSDADIYIDTNDYKVVHLTAKMLIDDIERVTGKRISYSHATNLPKSTAVIAGTLGHSKIIDQLIKRQKIDVSAIKDKWESFIITTTEHPKYHTPILAIIGSDRRGTAFALTSLSEAIGVSPWYWWADVTPNHKDKLFVEPGLFIQNEPSIQYRGIFINDERFGGWARWAEEHFEKSTGKVGPKTYQKVFELLLRLKANYLWPAMHPGTQAFNDNPDNARLADDYAIVMGSSHCEQMLRNNEGEWKAVGTYGDFNYITNRETMQKYWEDRIKTNGKYENTYTLGLRGIHDYPMEGANTTAERVKLMQKAIDDQRQILQKHINKHISDIPQVLCTYEEVLDAYLNGLQIPDDVTLLWSDDKHGYCRNLCNPQEQKRKGGAGIYYHLSYHGDPASWIWLSPLSPSFLCTELTKAYTFGARKIWVFNVGDIKPAEKELSFVMDLAWNINSWKPENAHMYIKYWASKTFGTEYAHEIALLQDGYYRLQAGGKDSHVWFINYSEQQIEQRIAQWRALAAHAKDLSLRIPEDLKAAYFELIDYPIRGAAMINEYQLLARRSMVRANDNDIKGASLDAQSVTSMFDALNDWTDYYNNRLLNGKWTEFFNWQPYHWYRSTDIMLPYYNSDVQNTISHLPEPRFINVNQALSDNGATFDNITDGEIDIWIKALTPIQNFSKEAKDNVFCHIISNSDSFDASATPINNVWHASHIGPMWSRVGTIHLKKGINHLSIKDLKQNAKIESIYLGLYPPFDEEPRKRIPATDYNYKDNNIKYIKGLGYTDALMVQPFDSPSYEGTDKSPYVEYELNILPTDSIIEIRTLPTLRVYNGRDARYAIHLEGLNPQIVSIHTDDFSAEWRRNVLHGFSSRSISIPNGYHGHKRLKIHLLDPGIVLQEILIK